MGYYLRIILIYGIIIAFLIAGTYCIVAGVTMLLNYYGVVTCTLFHADDVFTMWLVVFVGIIIIALALTANYAFFKKHDK